MLWTPVVKRLAGVLGALVGDSEGRSEVEVGMLVSNTWTQAKNITTLNYMKKVNGDGNGYPTMVMKVKSAGYMANIPLRLQALQSHPFLAML